jgi:hypothetical protein
MFQPNPNIEDRNTNIEIKENLWRQFLSPSMHYSGHQGNSISRRSSFVITPIHTKDNCVEIALKNPPTGDQ